MLPLADLTTLQVLVAIAPIAVLILALVAKLLHAAGYDKGAAGVEVAEELLQVVAGALAGHEHGETLTDMIVSAEKSPEAQDLLHRALAKAA